MYSNTITFQQWVDQVSQKANQLRDIVDQGLDLQKKWYALTYGLSDDQILALPQFALLSVPGFSQRPTAADIDALKYAIGVFKDLSDALNNVAALPQADRAGYFIPFI